jgi:hypothetical protein
VQGYTYYVDRANKSRWVWKCICNKKKTAQKLRHEMLRQLNQTAKESLAIGGKFVLGMFCYTYLACVVPGLSQARSAAEMEAAVCSPLNLRYFEICL